MNKFLLFIFIFSYSFAAHSQAVDFTYTTSNGLFCSPSVISFTASFTGSPKGFVWTFGNGTGSNSQNPAVTYNTPGSYLVKLIVIYQQTTSTVSKTIVVNPSITASIGFDRNYICKPGAINFTAASSGNISTYNWDFGDGSTASLSSNTITHNFAALGTYNVSLLATDVSGCFDSTKTIITVQSPPITGTASPTTGCIPANVKFNANAIIPSGSSVTNYSWDFGDGSPKVSTIINSTNHIYTTAGNYLPSLFITTSEGCTSNYIFSGVAYGTPPFNHIAYPVKPIICGSDPAVVISKATNANSYYWDFGDGNVASLSDTIIQHKYNTLGIKNITSSTTYNNCDGNSTTFQINVIGVIASYNYSNSCADKKTFSFQNTSQGNLSTVSWDFGDGSPIVNTRNAIHTFPSAGSFVTKLRVTDTVTGCADSYSQTIYTSKPALLNPDTSICRNTNTTFTVVNNYNNSADTYTWYVAGQQAGPYKDSTLTIKASIFGNFNNYVIINNGAQYCPDTIRLSNTLLVRGPDLSYTAPASICLNDLYPVNNTSKPYIPSDTVTLWYWNFGVNTINDSIYQPPPFVYTNPGTYNVNLTGIDKNGCKDSLIKAVTVNPLPFIYVIPAIDTLCSGNADTLIAFHSDKILWSPAGSLSCATCDTVLTSAKADTKYYIKATTQFGCSVTDSLMVKVYPPFTAAPVASDPYICLNDTVQLNVNPPGKRIVWSPATGLSGANNYGPIASPAQTTIYTATLTDSAGCYTSSTNITVHVKSLPTVDAGPDQFYPYNAPFTINPKYSNNVSSYIWTPGNLLSCSTCPFPGGTATKSNTFIIKVTSDSGCVATDSIKILVECKDAYLLMPNAFTPNNDNLNDLFYPLTRGVQTIIRFSVYDRLGNLVFESRNFPPNDKTFGWDGRVRGAEQPTAVFVYYLEALCDSGEKLYKKGSVVLIR